MPPTTLNSEEPEMCAPSPYQQAIDRTRPGNHAPVTSRYTRYVAMHPIRRGALPTDRVHRLIGNKLARGLPR